MIRFLVIAIVIVAIVDLALLVQRVGLPMLERTEKASPAPDSSEPMIAPIVAKPSSDRPVRPASSPSRRPDLSVARSTDRREKSSEDEILGPADGLLFDGKAIAIDGEGVERANESGEFQSIFWKGTLGNSGPYVRVVDGRFRLRVPADAELGVRDLKLRDELVDVEHDQFSPIDRRSILLRGRWPRPVRLHVVDAASNAELADVSILERNGGEFEWIHPGEVTKREWIVSNQRSPISMQAGHDESPHHWEKQLWVGALGHTWSLVETSFAEGGEVFVRLFPGADLEIAIENDVTAAKARVLRARPVVEAVGRGRPQTPDPRFDGELVGRPELELKPKEGGTTVVHGLRPGRYVVALEVGDGTAQSVVLGKVDVTLTAGSTTRATIVASIPPEIAPVPLAGTIFLPPEWDDDWITFDLRPLEVKGSLWKDERSMAVEEMHSDPRGRGFHRWDFGRVAPGRYRFETSLIPFQCVVDTGPSGRTDVAVVIDDPADVVIHVIDEAVGQPLSTELSVLRMVTVTQGLDGDSPVLNLDREIPAYRVRVPAGEYAWRDDKPFRVVSDRTVHLHPGANDVTVKVHRTSGITFQLECNGVSVPWDFKPGLPVDLKRVDGTRVPFVRTWTRSLYQVRCDVDEPGDYRVTVPDVPGYQPIEPFLVTIPRDRDIERTIELRLR